MSSLEKNTSITIIPEVANGDIFSVTNDAVNNIVSLAEARDRYGKINRGAHGAGAFVRHLLGSMGIDLRNNVAVDASELIRLRVTALNDDQPLPTASVKPTNLVNGTLGKISAPLKKAA